MPNGRAPLEPQPATIEGPALQAPAGSDTVPPLRHTTHSPQQDLLPSLARPAAAPPMGPAFAMQSPAAYPGAAPPLTAGDRPMPSGPTGAFVDPPGGPRTAEPAPTVTGPLPGGNIDTTGMAPCEGARILARVGSEVVLAGEVLSAVNEIIAKSGEKIPPEQLEMVREKLLRDRLKYHIETKLVFLDARRDIPAENFPKVETKIGEFFDAEEVEKLMKRAGADSRKQLEEKLRAMGSSLERERRAFVERTLAQQWIRQKLKVDDEVSHEEMRTYYRDHPADFELAAQARWEELMVRFTNHPDKAEAYQAIAALGNRALGGTAFAEVAKNGSEGSTAASGGQREWTTRGSLVAEELDRAIFGLPVGELSQIIETKQGFHIVRVLERKDASRVPFTEAQVKIRDKIKDLRGRQQMKDYIETLRQRYPVWTAFDEPLTAERPATR